MSQTSIARSIAKSVLLIAVSVLASPTAFAQGSVFVYQGKLTDGGNPANAAYDMQFRLFDTVDVGGGTQQGATITDAMVQVTSGVFSVSLDFGAGVFGGAARYLEIGVRPAGSMQAYTILAPRQPVTSTPYAIRSTTAAAADTAVNAANAANATNANKLGGLAASGFIQNTAMTQPATNFNISGDGTLGGTLLANTVNATLQYNLAGNRALAIGGPAICPTCNTFLGAGAGGTITSGQRNSFFGASAGQVNTGSLNSFFGESAGESNTTAWNNSFFGTAAGRLNTTGTFNSFFGLSAGASNTTADSNSFFGTHSGQSNTTGSNNSFFGESSGSENQIGSENSFFGTLAGFRNTGSLNSFFGFEAGKFNSTANNNSFFGYLAGTQNLTGDDNSFFGSAAGQNNTTGTDNAFFGRSAGINNTTASNNSFFGSAAGLDNTTGFDNAFFGRSAGRNTTTGNNNAFVGANAGQLNTTAGDNAFFGASAGQNNTASGNSFFGSQAGLANTSGCCNAFFGTFTGDSNTTGEENAFFGRSAGGNNITGSRNTFIGRSAGLGNSVGSDNTFIGYNANAGAFINNATAVGANAQVSDSDALVLGSINGVNGATATVNVGIGTTTPLDRLHVNGIIRVITLGAAGATSLCRNASNQIATCSSSLRYKTRIEPFAEGLELVQQLRPITFDWRQSGERDLGLAAEEVAQLEPLLVTHNERGEIEGVKYDRLTVALINAVKQQQAMISQQQKQISQQRDELNEMKAQLTALKKPIRAARPNAGRRH